MKNTKTNIVKLLKAMVENSESVSRFMEMMGEKKQALIEKRDAYLYRDFIELLTKPDYFNKKWAIFFKEVKQ